MAARAIGFAGLFAILLYIREPLVPVVLLAFLCGALAFLDRAATLMCERGQQYDAANGERSMGKAVAAFNALYGHDMTEADGWAFMLLLKMSRQSQSVGFHRDSAEDAVAYTALMAEALAWQSP